MMLRRALILATCLIATACADKFPYPPQFVTPEEISMNALPTPPAPDSKTFKNELNTIIATQKKLTQKEKDVIAAEDHIAPQMMVLPVLGKHYTEEKYPALYTLLRHAASDAWRIGDETQDHWNSPRPWYTDSRVTLYVKPITRPGYPSGHTVTNTVWAHVLSDLFPAKKAALLKRASDIGNHRVKAGAHFPHDVEGGKKLAGVIATTMKKSPDYQRELAAAKAELKAPAKVHAKANPCTTPIHSVSGGMVMQTCH